MQSNTNPTFIYGTAWKEEATTRLVESAITSGFRAVDTANQPKHYSEALVGQALLNLQQKGFSRESIFLQTKFTPINGHDARIPYNPHLDLSSQVQQSFASSLQHLHTDYVDSYLLHGPHSWPGLVQADWEVWGAIEEIYQSGKAKLIGVSNVNIQQLEALTSNAKTKPMIVQNRCFAYQGWDKAVREFCIANGIMYQGFSLLTANKDVLANEEVNKIANRLGRTPEQVVFRFAMQIGIVPLTGTTKIEHMQLDLQASDFNLTAADLQILNTFGMNAR